SKSRISNISYDEDTPQEPAQKPRSPFSIDVSENSPEALSAAAIAKETENNMISESAEAQYDVSNDTYPESDEDVAEEIVAIETESGDEESPAEHTNEVFEESDEDVGEELSAIESEENPESYEGSIEDAVYEEDDTAVKEEIVAIESEDDDSDEAMVEEELQEPVVYAKEQALDDEDGSEVADELETVRAEEQELEQETPSFNDYNDVQQREDDVYEESDEDVSEEISAIESESSDSPVPTYETTSEPSLSNTQTSSESSDDEVHDDDVIIEELDETKKNDITNLF
ncbi:MAG: hypothetical protein ACMXYK_04475, partial [Candidatus Woesearchaeota archaeon]